MDHPEAVVAFFLQRIKDVTSLVSKRHIVEKNILKKKLMFWIPIMMRNISYPPQMICES